MQRRLFILGLLVFCSIIVVDFQMVEAEEAKVVRIIENDWPPYYFKYNKSNRLPGFAKELLNICVPQMGFRPEFAFYPVKRMYTYLENGELDLALFSYRKSRESFVQYGQEPLFVSGYRPVVRADSDIQIHSLKDFDNLKIGHLAGLKYSKPFLDYIERRRKAGTLIMSTTGDSCLRMLTEGIIDIFVDTEATVLWRAQQMGLSEKIVILNYDIRTSEYFVTVSKTSPRITDKKGFLKQLDGCLNTLKKNGRYDKIAHKYGQ